MWQPWLVAARIALLRNRCIALAHRQYERAMTERNSKRPSTTMNSTTKGDGKHHQVHGGEHEEEATS